MSNEFRPRAHRQEVRKVKVVESIRLEDYERAVKTVFEKTGNRKWFDEWSLKKEDRIDVELHDDGEVIVSFKSGDAEVSYWKLFEPAEIETELLYEELREMGYFDWLGDESA